MSSVCAVWNQSGQFGALAMLDRMQEAQAMYGPAQRFTWGDERVALGGNLMRLLPEDEFDAQPLWSADRTCRMVADVRLDNRTELARKLGLNAPATRADSAILLEAWMRWGEGCLNHIVGAFAFVVWTPARQELFAARDHTGERPLFFHRSEGFVAVASMPKGLLALPGVFQGFNERRVVDAMALTAPDWHASYFRGIDRLPVGHRLVVTPDRCEMKAYWHPGEGRPVRFKRDEEYAEALREIFDKAVAARLRSPRGVGSQLSCGLDSSSVTASAAVQLGREGRRLTAFTAVPRPGFAGVGLPGRVADEGPGAREVAELYPNIDHVTLDNAGADLVGIMRDWTEALDEPVQNTINLIWELATLREARDRGLGVMLQGAFGNATISFESGGALADLFRRGRWLKLIRTVRSLRGHGDLSWRNAFLEATNGLLPGVVRDAINPRRGEFSLDFLPAEPGIVEKFKLEARTRARCLDAAAGIREERGEFFRRFDFGPIQAAAQALSGVDFRDPTGDKRVFDFCYAIPIEQYIVGGHSRSLVRRAMKGRLPDATVERYARGQQGADWHMTVGEALPSLAGEAEKLKGSPAARHFVDLGRMQQLIETWPDAGHETGVAINCWNYALTRGIGMGMFLQKFEASEVEAAAQTEGSVPMASPTA